MTDTPTSMDVQAKLSRLFIHPIKSCAPIAVQRALLTATGLEWDRAWMVVDQDGECVTQRELPRMALVWTRLTQHQLLLNAPHMPLLGVPLAVSGTASRVQVWGEELVGLNQGDAVSQWFTQFLLDPAHRTSADAGMTRLRLVRFDPQQQRLANRKWTGGVEAPNQFSDGFPVLVAGEGSLAELNRRLALAGHARVGMERFRPNLVLDGLEPDDEDRLDELVFATPEPMRMKLVKPCQRCPIPNVDPATALSSPEVGDTLQTYRRNDVLGGAITFGMNAITLGGVGQWLEVGQAVGANYHFG